MKLEADFTKISTEFEQLPDGEYIVVVDDIEEGESSENKLPQLNIALEVTEGEYEGRKITDFVTLRTTKGKRNDIGFGRIKAYQEAIHGLGSADSGDIDTDELKKGTVLIVVKQEPYVDKKTKETKVGARIKKVLPVN